MTPTSPHVLPTLAQTVAGGEVAVIGIGRSGAAVARLLRAAGGAVYVSDLGAGETLQAVAAALRTEGISVDLGTHDLARIARCSLVVVSPGVPPGVPPLVAARAAQVPIVSEIEIGLRGLAGVPYIGVTGTNGKTTVTALIAHLARALGIHAVEAGNIGTPLAEIAMAASKPGLIALELSSFQLHDTPSIDPAVAVLTNLAPDHLDRYASLEAYYADKDLLFRNASAKSVRIVNADDAEVMRRTKSVPGVARTFSVGASVRHDLCHASYDSAAQMLMVGGAPLLERGLLPLLGAHNVANALCATLAVWEAFPGDRSAAVRAKLAVGLESFSAPPHRLEPVGERDGVLWVNDSKATNIGAARVAIEAMNRPTILLLGGRHKGEPYSALIPVMQGRVKQVLAYGEAADVVQRDLEGHVAVERCGSSFEHVVDRARALAQTGDAVLLAPACSSYDMFLNYEARGAAFRALALPSSMQPTKGP